MHFKRAKKKKSSSLETVFFVINYRIHHKKTTHICRFIHAIALLFFFLACCISDCTHWHGSCCVVHWHLHGLYSGLYSPLPSVCLTSMCPHFIVPVDTSESINLFCPVGCMGGESDMRSLCWHIVSHKPAWHARNGVPHFGHLSPCFSCVRQGTHLALHPLAIGVTEGVHRPCHSPQTHMAWYPQRELGEWVKYLLLAQSVIISSGM